MGDHEVVHIDEIEAATFRRSRARDSVDTLDGMHNLLSGHLGRLANALNRGQSRERSPDGDRIYEIDQQIERLYRRQGMASEAGRDTTALDDMISQLETQSQNLLSARFLGGGNGGGNGGGANSEGDRNRGGDNGGRN